MPPLIQKQMLNDINFLLIIKYALACILTIGIVFAPAWVARQNGKGKPDMHAVRLGSWIFGWSIIGWLWALFWATRK
ncbi:MAG: superinfection immunity protein [Alphaproteobacteria bacterium]|nr:superinfection immunity protein [Alphaproteobacteria bacterium]